MTFQTSGAQRVSFKIGGGVASRTDGMRVVGNFRIGVGCSWDLDHHWGFEPSVLYVIKGWKNHDKEVLIYDEGGEIVLDEEGNAMTGVMNVTTGANYIEMPLDVHYRLDKFTFLAGPYIACGIGGKAETSGDTEAHGAERFYHAHSTFSETGMHRLDVGVGCGVDYDITEQFRIGIRGEMGLTKVCTSGGRNQSLAVCLAYCF